MNSQVEQAKEMIKKLIEVNKNLNEELNKYKELSKEDTELTELLARAKELLN